MTAGELEADESRTGRLHAIETELKYGANLSAERRAELENHALNLRQQLVPTDPLSW